MAFFLRADGVGAFVEKDLVAAVDEAWLTLDLTFEIDTGGAGLLQAFDATSLFAVSYGTLNGWEELAQTFDTNLVPVAKPLGIFQTLEMHYDKGAVIEAWVDGLALWSTADTVNKQFQNLLVGQLISAGGGPTYIDNVKLGSTRGGSEYFSDDFESGDLSAWDFTNGDVSVVEEVAGGATIVTGPPSYQWRFVVTKLNQRVLTFLDRLAREKRATYVLNKAAIAGGVVPADNPEVNIVQSDGFPLLEEGVRILYGFRREGGIHPWVCRYGGIILQVEDNVDENGGAAPYTTFTAYDPRQILYARPIRDADGNLPGADGLSFDATPGSEIALTLLARSFDADGEHYIDVDGGSIETTDEMDIHFDQGISVGEAWDALNESGNLDIILTALYDPDAYPGKIARFNCYDLAGTTRHKAVMAWDKPSRSLVGVNRLTDGTQRANRIAYHYGAGGPSVGTVSNFGSVATFGDYWAQQFFPGKNAAAVELLALEQLLLRKNGVKTYRLNPVPGSLGQIDSPIPFLDYFLGDSVPTYTSSRFRKEIAVGKRVVELPIVIADDGRERVEQLGLGEGEVSLGGGGGGGDGGGDSPPTTLDVHHFWVGIDDTDDFDYPTDSPRMDDYIIHAPATWAAQGAAFKAEQPAGRAFVYQQIGIAGAVASWVTAISLEDAVANGWLAHHAGATINNPFNGDPTNKVLDVGKAGVKEAMLTAIQGKADYASWDGVFGDDVNWWKNLWDASLGLDGYSSETDWWESAMIPCIDYLAAGIEADGKLFVPNVSDLPGWPTPHSAIDHTSAIMCEFFLTFSGAAEQTPDGIERVYGLIRACIDAGKTFYGIVHRNDVQGAEFAFCAAAIMAGDSPANVRIAVQEDYGSAPLLWDSVFETVLGAPTGPVVHSTGSTTWSREFGGLTATINTAAQTGTIA